MSREWIASLPPDERRELIKEYQLTIEGMDRALSVANHYGVLNGGLSPYPPQIRKSILQNPLGYLVKRNKLAGLANELATKEIIRLTGPEDYKGGRLAKPKPPKAKRETARSDRAYFPYPTHAETLC